MLAEGWMHVVIRPASRGWLRIDQHLRTLAAYTDLLYTLSLHRISVRYKQTVAGVLWAVLQPLLMMVIFTIVFSKLARIPSEGVPYALFAYTALLPWTLFSTAVANGTNSLVTHTQLITKVYFPREILPVTYLVAALFDFVMGLVVLALLMAWYRVPPTPYLLAVIPLLVLLCAWALAVMLVLAAVQVRFRDVGVALPVIVQLWMFASPVIYPLSVVPGRWRWWYDVNPMTGIIAAFRDALLQRPIGDVPALQAGIVVTAVVLPIAYAFFKRAEATMADVI
ncbi:MAG TPA: ABC transporter permease [Vicinamibacterales bacterium]|nr:ABC transporter permease [Vicinamibacterales bacterium]